VRVAVIGATGQTGPTVVRRLLDAGHDVLAIGRSEAKLRELDSRARRARADAAERDVLAAALDDAEATVTLAPHTLLAEVLAALPVACRRIVVSGSIRKYSRYRDAGARSARRVDATMRASGRGYVVLNHSLIYGGRADRTINRLCALIRRSAVIPLPDGGRHTVQPIHVEDMAAAVAAAVTRPEAAQASIDVAGPRPMTYREVVEACAAALGRRVRILPVPAWPFVAAETVAGWAGATLPLIGELARMAEDKRIDIGPMRARLGVQTMEFAEGLRRVLELNGR
jgi:NADH dehydrogenase